jgi:outer membrane protein TolC
VGFSYSQRESSFGRDHPDLYSGFVGINLPIWFKSKQSKKVEEARYDKRSAENRYEAVKNELEFRVSALLAEIEQNSQLIELYRDAIIPQANHTLNSSVDSYQVGSVDFLTLLTNLQTLYRYELESGASGGETAFLR